MNDPITNPTPKQRFVESADNISKHRTLVDSREFERASDFAFMQMAARMAVNTPETDERALIAAALKLKGAVEFMSEFRLLGEKPTPAKIVSVQGNLDHKLQ